MSLLGIDVGGSFTDFYLWQNGGLQVHKRPSTPDNPAIAVLDGLREQGWRPDLIVHGSTVATNAVLERRGAKTAFVTTKGFRDLLAIGRQARPRLYDLEPKRPPPLAPRDRSFEVDERLDYTGAVLAELSIDEARRVAKAVVASGAEAVAVCLLFSFLNPAHERRLGEALREAGIDPALSSEVLPEPREYERASTTVLNAYVTPVMRRYLRDLERGVGAASRLQIMQSSGGAAAVEQVAALPVSTLLSGPAGGVAGAFAVAAAAGYPNAISFDMGGTSTDVALCPGRIPFTTEWSVNDLPVRVPSVDVHTVGAGGGSVAWLDAGGALRVGPESAGAAPGPACYSNGGPPTVTDAHVALGRLKSEWFLGGRFPLDAGAAERALAGLGAGTAVEAARGIIAVANASMERALRVVSVERGHDPRDFALVAFGGAGPLHACDLADALSIGRVAIPRYPGVLSAYGMVFADETHDVSLGLLQPVPRDDDGLAALETHLRALFAEQASRLTAELGAETVVEPALDLRYEGQAYELTIDWEASLAAAVEAFHALHQRRYGHADRRRPVEVVALRSRGRLRREEMAIPALAEAGADAAAARRGTTRAWLGGEVEAAVYDRDRLLAGNVIDGPAVVVQMDSTTLLPRGWRGVVDVAGNLVLERR